jgi:hypothetical protein
MGRLLLLGAVFSSIAASLAAKHCKCLPGDSCFPSEAQLNAFSGTLSHPLVSKLRPLGAPCYPNTTEFSSIACSNIKTSEPDATFRANQFNALQYENAEYIINPDGTFEGCPFDPQPGDVCHQGRVPSYAVNASTVSDIQKTVQFATQHNLHLVVKNTGFVTYSF